MAFEIVIVVVISTFLIVLKSLDHMTKEENNFPFEAKRVKIVYTNWRGIKSERLITPISIRLGKNQWHPKECYLLNAYDCQKMEVRTFAIKDIHSWEEIK